MTNKDHQFDVDNANKRVKSNSNEKEKQTSKNYINRIIKQIQKSNGDNDDGDEEPIGIKNANNCGNSNEKEKEKQTSKKSNNPKTGHQKVMIEKLVTRQQEKKNKNENEKNKIQEKEKEKQIPIPTVTQNHKKNSEKKEKEMENEKENETKTKKKSNLKPTINDLEAELFEKVVGRIKYLLSSQKTTKGN